MSTLIENIARGTKDAITGGPASSALDKAQTERGHNLIKQFATGGLALGAGASTVVALVNHLKTLKQEEELEDESRLNDDTLYIPTEKSAAEGVNKWLAPGLAVTGGILSAGGAYALTQKVYNYMQKKRLQSKLDEAQGEALLAADDEMGKMAAEKMNTLDALTAAPVAIPLLTALASGGITFAALHKAFPTIKKPKSKHPKRIRQVTDSGEVVEKEEPIEKMASIVAQEDLESAAKEFLVITTDTFAMEKKADHSITSDILNRAAKDGVKGLEETYKSAGLNGLSASVQGASDTPASFEDKIVGAALLFKSARLGPIVSRVAAAEYQDLVPGICAIVADQQDDNYIEKMAHLGAVMHLEFFRPHVLSKEASSGLLDQLGAALSETTPHEAMEEELNTDAGGFMSDEAEGGDEEFEQDEILKGDEKDPVDDFMELGAESEQEPLQGLL